MKQEFKVGDKVVVMGPAMGFHGKWALGLTGTVLRVDEISCYVTMEEHHGFWFYKEDLKHADTIWADDDEITDEP
jgi:hypothetical protein